MFTIKHAAEVTGVNPATLRAWESRYGIGRPTRTASGYRLYDERALAEIRTMLELIDAGWAPAQAAVETLLRVEQSARPLAPAATEEVVERLLAAAHQLDDGALNHDLDVAFLGRGIDEVCREVIMPTMARAGAAWEAGRFPIASEHLLSHAIVRRLSASFEAAEPPTGPRVVVGLPTGSRHEIPALAFATSLRHKGCAVSYLGADTPTEAWLGAIAAQPVAAVAVSVPTLDVVPTATETVEALRNFSRTLKVAAGGRFAGALPGYVTVLSEDIGTASAELAIAITNQK